MEENMTVSMDALGSELETVQADAVPTEEVELLGATESQETGVSAPGTEPQAAAAPELRYTQEEFDEAVRRKSEYIRNGLKNDPIYMYAQSLVNQYATDGTTPQEAIAKAQAAQREQLIAELSADPKRMAEFFLNQQQTMAAPNPDTIQAKAARLASELKTLEVQGVLPQNFQLEAYNNADPELFVNAEQLGWRAALKIAEAKMSVAAPQPVAAPAPAPVLPQSTRPTNSAQPSSIDFGRMDSKRFAELEARIDAALADGKRVVF